MADGTKYRFVQYYFFHRLEWEKERLDLYYFPSIVPYEVLREALEDETDRLVEEFELIIKS